MNILSLPPPQRGQLEQVRKLQLGVLDCETPVAHLVVSNTPYALYPFTLIFKYFNTLIP